jgi:hypothetical protein
MAIDPLRFRGGKQTGPVSVASRMILKEKKMENEVTQHSDDLAVDKFANAMKAKLKKKREQGYHGWDNPQLCHIERLKGLLQNAFYRDQPDPVDIANYVMMIWNRELSDTKGE